MAKIEECERCQWSTSYVKTYDDFSHGIYCNPVNSKIDLHDTHCTIFKEREKKPKKVRWIDNKVDALEEASHIHAVEIRQTKNRIENLEKKVKLLLAGKFN